MLFERQARGQPSMLNRIKKVGRVLKRLPDRLAYPRPSRTFYRFGSEFAGWWIETARLDERSRILSAGVGEDITFDLALIQRFGCHILACDPTSKAVAYVERFRAERRLRFEACGLAEKDGEIRLFPPEKPQYASFSMSQNTPPSPGQIFPAKSLKTLLGENGWEAFDLVKMDIEGSEYEVIDSIIENRICIKQLCVEFHHKIGAEIGRKTRDSIRQLEDYGLKLVYKEYDNYTFLNH
jgi:FkbM family methyltransferase